MSKDSLAIGEFQPFIDGIEAAVLSGSDVDQCVDKLGQRPAFGDGPGKANLTNGEFVKETRRAQKVTGARNLCMDIEDKEPTTDIIVISKTGAVALRGRSGNTASEAIDLLQRLDGWNTPLIIHAHTSDIG